MGEEGLAMQIDDILGRLEKIRKSGQGWIARCPAHDDSNPSLSIKFTESGRLLAYCHAGCTFDEIRQALGLAKERREGSPQIKETGPTPEQIEAQKKAIRLWKNSKPARLDHPYIIRKKIQTHHARQIGTSLVIPMQDARGDLWNLQFIPHGGTKRFLKGGKTKGLFTFIGEIQEAEGIYIAEGWATGCTIHELTGRPVFTAFSASNLPSVALVVRRSFPQVEIILAADADPVGETCSEDAARAIDGRVAYAGRIIDGR